MKSEKKNLYSHKLLTAFNSIFMKIKPTILFFSILSFLFSCSAPKKNFGNIEVRPFEGDIYYKYINDSLHLTLSLGGGVVIVPKPTTAEIKKALATSFKYDISDTKMAFVENVLYAKDHFGDDAEYDLIQVYRTKGNRSIESVLQNLTVEHTLPNKNICFKQDSFKRVRFNGKNLYASKYAIVVGTKFTQVAQCFFEQQGYLLRFLTFGKNLTECAHDARNFTDSFELSTIKDIDRSKVDLSTVQASFSNSKHNYIEPIYLLNRVSDSEKIKNLSYGNYSAFAYSFIGDYKNTLKYRLDFAIKENPNPKPEYFSKFEPESALNIVKYIPDSCRIVMINENHLNPYSRVFMRNLLKPLLNKGFTCFAAETFDPENFGQIEQKMGQFTTEPNFGNLVRAALNMGFKTFPYECNFKLFDPNIHKDFGKFREEEEAQNLKQLLEQNPTKKFIVYAGHNHIWKTKDWGDVTWMAKIFKEKTGITPFCIDQSIMIEEDSTDYESSYYIQAHDKYHLKESSIFTKGNELFVQPNFAGAIDVQIFHPRTTYDANGYATWLLNQGDIKKTFSFVDPKFKDCIFQIYEYFEFGRLPFGDAIPMLNLPLDGKNTFDVKLEHGNYYAKVYDRFRNELYSEIFILK